MKNPLERSDPRGQIPRRTFLSDLGMGFTGLALGAMLNGDGIARAATTEVWKLPDGKPHFPPKAKSVIWLFMIGGVSHMDTFDYKPLLLKQNGRKFDPGGKIELFQSAPGNVMQSPWEWKQHGQSGRWVSSLLPHLATCADEMAFLYAMVSKSNGSTRLWAGKPLR